jgi:hypothetical protein
MCHFSLLLRLWPVFELCLDRADFYGREELAMALFPAIAFSALVFENKDFPAFALFHDRAVDNGIFKDRLSDFDVIPIRYHQNLIEGHAAAHFARDLFYFQGVAFLNPILFTARCYDSVHVCSSINHFSCPASINPA